MPSALPRTAPVSADDVVCHTLLNCLLREVCGPEHHRVDGGRLLLRLPRTGVRLAVGLRRVSPTGAHRFRGPVSEQRPGRWTELPWHALASRIERELHLATGYRNDEFLAQVAASRAGQAAAMAGRPVPQDDPYLASEQSLRHGHRFHPTPKARGGSEEDWARYAPEAGARFPLRLLAVRADLVREQTAVPDALAALDRQGAAPPGYRLLPTHPWQYAMLRDHAGLHAARLRRHVIDLGTGRVPFAPTASVRTLYDGRDFLKFSLNVRITNCVRKNADYELAGAVALTRVLEPVARELAARFPGCDLLREPGYRTLDVGSRELAEGLGVIVREGLAARLHPGSTGLLAAAVADEHPGSDAQVGRLLAGAGPQEALRWWNTYLRLLVPPVLAAFFDHGVVLEPHLQNVVVGVGPDGHPRQVLFRDLEGTKLLSRHHAAALAELPVDVAGPLVYRRARGWDRVVYCLLVNHLAEMVAALADLHPEQENALWAAVAKVLSERRAAHGDPPELRALTSGVPLPAKANLLTRWSRAADREARYVPLPSPFAPAVPTATAPDDRSATAPRPRSQP
ncbi:IucA/IucC family protein [Streptomyces sp. 549]|uniref:IucA/IucC family protein n=1 Tax=Streptomyces sp. 549 TaxID=3049076 RepID=UPI0024C34CB4|nr:IucA/IucC family protein [Streptomyces sp. 549]MDK1475677.1 IucA/IucC family protein [Streptomyces sp. 549]